MYYVNFNDGSAISNIPTHLVVSLLKIPPDQRALKDHEIIFKYFIDNPILNEIQRTKSLNSRLECVAKLQIQEGKPLEQEEMKIIGKIKAIDESAMQKARKQKHLRRKQSDQPDNAKDQQIIYLKYYVVLPNAVFSGIMEKNQKHLREKIELLKKYNILKNMTYQQLLHLSYYLEQQSYKYKQYVYKEGDLSHFLYFVEEGEFHFIKLIAESSGSLENKKKSKKPQRYEMLIENPNKVKNSRSIEYEIGIVQGKSGQAFGDEEIMNGGDKNRQYSVKCMSTQNKVLKVHKQYYLNVIKGTRTQMNWLKQEKQRKNAFKKENLNKIMLTKHNYTKYLQVLSHTQNKEQSQLLYYSNGQKQSNDANKEGNHLNKVKSTSSFALNPQQTSYVDLQKSNSITQHLKNTLEGVEVPQLNKHGILRSQQSEQNHQTFSLTKPYGSRQRNLTNNINSYSTNVQTHLQTQGSKNQSLLPSISGKSSPNYDNSDSNKVKSWSASRPAIELRDMRSKFTKMIDSNSLIKEKQIILQRKLTKQTRQDIFPIDMPLKKNKKMRQLEHSRDSKIKTDLRQLRSAAHSKDFMQNLLIESLRKAGYNTSKNSQNYTADNQNSIYDIKTNIRVPRKKREQKKNYSHSLLEDNPFDQYYFKKG